MIPHFDVQARVKFVVHQMRVAPVLGRADPTLLRETDGSAELALIREYPVEAVERTLIQARVVFESPHDAGGQRTLRRSVRAVR